jgi:hypothetical protein
VGGGARGQQQRSRNLSRTNGHDVVSCDARSVKEGKEEGYGDTAAPRAAAAAATKRHHAFDANVVVTQCHQVKSLQLGHRRRHVGASF